MCKYFSFHQTWFYAGKFWKLASCYVTQCPIAYIYCTQWTTRVRNNLNSCAQQWTLKSPEKKTSHSASHIHLATVIPWHSAQSDLRVQHSKICFSKKPRHRVSYACSTSLLTDSTLQRSHAAGHAHWSSLTRLTFPGKQDWFAMQRLKRPYSARQYHHRTHPPPQPPTSLTATSRAGKVNAWDFESQPLNLRGSQPQNKGMPFECGTDRRLEFLKAPLRR